MNSDEKAMPCGTNETNGTDEAKTATETLENLSDNKGADE